MKRCSKYAIAISINEIRDENMCSNVYAIIYQIAMKIKKNGEKNLRDCLYGKIFNYNKHVEIKASIHSEIGNTFCANYKRTEMQMYIFFSIKKYIIITFYWYVE